MTHTLNLYDPRWLARRKAAPPWQPMAVLGGAALAAALVAAWNQWEHAHLQARLAEVQAETKRLSAASDPGGDRGAALAALAEAAQRREQTVAQWRGLDAAPTNSKDAGGAAASQWFSALGAVVVESVWLTRVQLDVTGALRLEGQARDGVALSEYLERWRQEPLLTGIALQTLEMRRANDTQGKPPADGSQRLGADVELAFTLSNLAAGRAPGANDAAAPTGGAGNAARNAAQALAAGLTERTSP